MTPTLISLDTSAYSNLRRGHELVLDWVAGAQRVTMSTTVLGELEAGFRLGSRYRENAATLAEFLSEPFVCVEAVTALVARKYGEVFQALRSAGTPIPTNDIWIAASAIESGSHLLTFDADFERVSGLDYTLLSG